MNRCGWAGGDPIYAAYHDAEWGVPVHDDSVLFEFLLLESAQAGLSWLTLLKRREGYRRVFKDFDVSCVAAFTEQDIQEALQDIGIIRNKLKVRAAVKNAQVFLTIQQEFDSFSDYIWAFANHKPIINNRKITGEVPVTSEVSDALSKDLKNRGMTFVGSTIMYAYMQAVGIVNDHTLSCFRYNSP
jgi:DNA-3-methyladenine glycosylase I